MRTLGSRLTLCLPRWNASYDRQGGVTTISLQMAHHWKRLGCRVVWVGVEPPHEFAGEFACYQTAPTTSDLVRGILDAASNESLDLLVTFEPFVEGPAAAEAKLNLGIPFAHVGMHFAPHADTLLKEAESRTYTNADMFIYQCQWFLDNYIAVRFNKDIAYRSKSIAVPFGADTAMFRPSETGLTSDQRQIVFIGRLNRENCEPPEYDKGAAYLIDALPQIIREFGPINVTLIGSGPQLPALVVQASHLGVTPHVAFVGDAEPSLALEYLQTTSLFVLPSVCDIFPVAIVEALSTGVPVVSTAVGGISECVDSSCGVLVEPKRPDLLAAAIIQLLENVELRREMAISARSKAVAQFDWSIAASRILKAFEELVTHY